MKLKVIEAPFMTPSQDSVLGLFYSSQACMGPALQVITAQWNSVP